MDSKRKLEENIISTNPKFNIASKKQKLYGKNLKNVIKNSKVNFHNFLTFKNIFAWF